MPSISYQLYSSRNWDSADTLAMLAELGIEEVEGFGPYLEAPVETRAALDEHELKMPTAHVGLAMLEADPDAALMAMKTLGVEAVFAPYLPAEQRPTTVEGWKQFADKLAQTAKPFLAAGLAFGWHNHDFEFLALDDGSFAIEHIMAAGPDISLELDLAWAVVADQDPLMWLERFKGRVIAAHVKDIAPAGEASDEDGWADVGHGTMDWAALSAKLAETGVTRLVLEHDNPSDHRRFATRSFATASKF